MVANSPNTLQWNLIKQKRTLGKVSMHYSTQIRHLLEARKSVWQAARVSKKQPLKDLEVPETVSMKRTKSDTISVVLADEKAKLHTAF
jgi:hypothetical protein